MKVPLVTLLALTGCASPGGIPVVGGARVGERAWVEGGEGEPLLSGTSWELYGEEPGTGMAVERGRCDVNGDGVGDVLVAAPYATTRNGTRDDAGWVEVYLGAVGGPSTTPDWRVEGQQEGEHLGDEVACGDANGDGYSDVAIASPDLNADGEAYRGRVSLYAGSAGGLTRAAVWSLTGAFGWSFVGEELAFGDGDGDGYADLAMTTRGGGGQVEVYEGSATWLSGSPVWSTEVTTTWLSSVAWVGDVNGDGYSELVIGEGDHDEWPLLEVGRVRLFYGRSTGLATTAWWELVGAEAYEHLGDGASGVGDLDGDSFADVVVADDPNDEAGSGLRVYHGSWGGLSTEPAWTSRGELDRWASAAGDVNGDGWDDLYVGVPWESHGLPETGAGYVYFGSPTGVGDLPGWLEYGDRAGAGFGSGAGVGDVTGDGRDDLIVNATSYDVVEELEGGEGASFLYRSFEDEDGDGVVDESDTCLGFWNPAQEDEDEDGVGDGCDAPWLTVGEVTAGASVRLTARGVGAREEVSFWGAPGEGGSGPCPADTGLCLSLGSGAVELGRAVADEGGEAALDWRAPWALEANGRYVAQAVVERGSEASQASEVVGVDGTGMDWDGDGLTDAEELWWATDPRSEDTDGDGIEDQVEIRVHLDPTGWDTDGDGVGDGRDGCQQGDDGADEDGDGVADACDTCPGVWDVDQWDGDGDGVGSWCEGWGPVGPVWTVDTDRAEAEVRVASGGDVNGDGYEDVLVGSPGYYLTPSWNPVGVGGLAVFAGGPMGPGASPLTVVTEGQEYSDFGEWSGSAGDVNGDGYGEVWVSAPTEGLSDNGAVYVYSGSASGLVTSEVWRLRGEGGFDSLGTAVSGGDVNGDGYGDLVVGDKYDADGGANVLSGEVRAYLGSATGLSAEIGWAVTGEGEDLLGESVSTGDLDGDGADEVVASGRGWGNSWVKVLGYSATGGTEATWQMTGDLEDPLFPKAEGDQNGDGYEDLVIGGEDRVRLYLGSPRGLDEGPVTTLVEPDSRFGDSGLASGGDVDGDGYDDLLVSGDEVYLHLGGPTGLSERAAWFGGDGLESGWFGATLATADVNGDGLGDVLIGDQIYSDDAVWEPEEGRAVLYLGVPR